MNDTSDDGARALRHAARTLILAWAALLVLMLLSFGSAYLNLGAGNLITGLVIATLKTAIVVWLFMHLPRANAATRIAAIAGIAMLALLMLLSLTDFLTRSDVPAPTQPPQQIEPWGG